ncbi:hypothetical protein RJ55_03157 [Drechmeria coniospora]|nr:hypothetical protein RJ55_03157 [Drechmeria coniospora]
MAKAITSGDMVDLGIGTAPIFSAEGVERILSSTSTTTSTSEAAGHCGLVMPVRATLNGPDVDDDVSSRKIRLHAASQAPEYLEIEEEIGESIARHIWDAGVVALSAIVGTYTLPDMACSQHACMKALRRILDSGEPINILEIGCGVGILGTGLCAIYPPGTRGCTILMTDLDEAEGRARSNIALLKHNQSVSRLGQAHLLYENLDWEHARHGRFGRQVQRRRWDLVVLSDCTYNVDMLPALVETLSALHASNVRRDDGFVTRVFLATKPRHESEKALFDLLAGDGWETLQTQILPLPVLGKETESVEMYLFEKASCPIRK